MRFTTTQHDCCNNRNAYEGRHASDVYENNNVYAILVEGTLHLLVPSPSRKEPAYLHLRSSTRITLCSGHISWSRAQWVAVRILGWQYSKALLLPISMYFWRLRIASEFLEFGVFAIFGIKGFWFIKCESNGRHFLKVSSILSNIVYMFGRRGQNTCNLHK